MVRCPICNTGVRSVDMPSHYALELARLDANPYVPPPAPGERSKRGAAVAALNRMHERPKSAALVDDHEKVLLHKVRAERVKRAAGRGTLSSKPTSGRGRRRQQPGPPVMNAFGYQEVDARATEDASCFMCGCLCPQIGCHQRPHRPGNAAGDDSIDLEGDDRGETGSGNWGTYEWGGFQRVRATALLEGSFEASGFSVHKKTDMDTDEDLDIDDDGTAEFGQAQFAEDDIQPFLDIEGDDDEDEHAAMEVALAVSLADTGASPSIPQPQGHEPKPAAPASTPPGPSRPTLRLTLGGPSAAPPSIPAAPLSSNPSSTAVAFAADAPVGGSTKLVIESLKSRVRELEASQSNVPKCLVCREIYTEPLASIVCWHVHCKDCWLHTLASKRLCPQCQKITAPADLRRVYL
ncbi:hypothetical protein BC831DRAFT_469299 [Entophlyctis helioformis]|nr:hypothetical protein BC831DRAFT_469299 [Entophlyctis helioformis]